MPHNLSKAHVQHARYFYTAAAIFLFVLMFLGFQLFYLQGKSFPGREITPPIRSAIILHGVFMTSWMLLLVVQPLLIARRNRSLHMKLGWLGVILAILATYFGFQVGVGSARVAPPEFVLWGLNAKQFMAISVFSITIYAILVGAAIWKRKNPEAHRTLILLAALMVIPAAMDRIEAIRNLYVTSFLGAWFGPFFASMVIAAIFALVYSLLTRSINRWLSFGFLGLSAVSFFIMHFSTTSVWDTIATWLIG